MAHKLRDKWLDEEKLRKLQWKAEDDRDKIRAAVDALRKNGYPVVTVEDIEGISADGCRKKIEEGRAAYLERTKGLFFPQSIIDDAMRQFDAAETECVKAAPTVSSILAEYPTVSYKMDSSGRFWWDAKTLGEYLEKEATLPFDETDKRIYELLGNTVDALNALHQFEIDNDLVEFSIQSPWENTPSLQDTFRESGKGDDRFDTTKTKFVLTPAKFAHLKNWHMVSYRKQQFRDAEKRAREDYEKYRRPVQ